MTAVEREVVLIGCSEIAPLVEAAGWRVHEIDYFWGSEDVDAEWSAAVVDIRVGGGTGLQVAARLKRCAITPLVLHSRAERDQVTARFAGIVRSNVGSATFFRVLELCAEETTRRRSGATTEPIDAGSIIVSERLIPKVVNARRASTVRARPPAETDRIQ